jgi:hypothetical protein
MQALRTEAFAIAEDRKKAEAKIAAARAELEKLETLLAERKAKHETRTRELFAALDNLEAEANVIELRETAEKMDRDGDDSNLFARFEELANFLAFKGFVAARSFEMRSMAMRRMRRDADTKYCGRPFRSWVTLTNAWLRTHELKQKQKEKAAA